MKAKFWKTRTVGTIRALHPTSLKVIEVNPQNDAIIKFDLDRELRRLPGLVAWYMALRDTAETAFREARHQEHNTEEDLYQEYREKLGKVTETVVKMAVKRDPRMRDAYRERMDAEAMFRQLKSAVEAVLEKRWSLQAIVKHESIERPIKDNA